jgi:hypothetical protein
MLSHNRYAREPYGRGWGGNDCYEPRKNIHPAIETLPSPVSLSLAERLCEILVFDGSIKNSEEPNSYT